MRGIIAVADVSNEVDKLKKKQKEDLANGLEVVKGAKTALFFGLAATKGLRGVTKGVKKYTSPMGNQQAYLTLSYLYRYHNLVMTDPQSLHNL